MMLFVGAAYCALNKSTNDFVMRTMGSMHVIGVAFSAWVATRENHQAVSGAMPAVWGLVHLLIAIYMLTAGGNQDGKKAAAAAAAPATSSPAASHRKRGRSPRKTA